MKIALNFEKKHFYFLVLVFMVFGLLIFARGLTSNNKPWHPLQEVSTSSTGQVSVDADGNGIIDRADDITVSTDASSINGKVVYWDGTDPNKLCYNTAGICTTVTATCPAWGNYIFNTDVDFGTCSNFFCENECGMRVRCNGDGGACPGTNVYYDTGTCVATTCGSTISCRCSCSLSTATQYQQGTLSGTKKCTTFVDST